MQWSWASTYSVLYFVFRRDCAETYDLSTILQFSSHFNRLWQRLLIKTYYSISYLYSEKDFRNESNKQLTDFGNFFQLMWCHLVDSLTPLITRTISYYCLNSKTKYSRCQLGRWILHYQRSHIHSFILNAVLSRFRSSSNLYNGIENFLYMITLKGVVIFCVFRTYST